MVELFEQDRREEARHSSKGNQLKWKKGEYWYKVDYVGYEGLAEYMVSCLLRFSSMGQDVIMQMPRAEAKTFCRSFEEQLEIAEGLYGEQLHFQFDEKEVRELLEADQVYSEEVKQRVYTILLQQRRKYQYLFRR